MSDEAHSLITLATTPDEELLDLLAREINFYQEVLRKRANRTLLTAGDMREVFHRMWDVAHIESPTPPDPEPHPDEMPTDIKPSYKLPPRPDLLAIEEQLKTASEGFLRIATRRRRRI